MKIFVIKLFLLFALSVFVTGIFAQHYSRPVQLKAGLAFGSEIKNAGINVAGSFHFTDQIRGAPGFTYFFPKTENTSYGEQTTYLWEVNLDGQYLIMIPEKSFHFYGLAGLNFSSVRNKGVTSDPIDPSEDYYFEKRAYNFGVNGGLGFEFSFSKIVSGIIDIKYVISEYDQIVVRLGVGVRIK